MSDGRFALVTGAAQGMGFAAASKFLAMGFGGVLLVDRNTAKLTEAVARLKPLGRVETLSGDLMDVSLPARAVAAAVAAFGGLEVQGAAVAAAWRDWSAACSAGQRKSCRRVRASAGAEESLGRITYSEGTDPPAAPIVVTP